MDVYEAVRTILAVRQYQDKPIPPEVMRKIVDAAHLTASSINKQPWHFVVVQNRDTLRQLGDLVRTGPYIAQAPLAVAVAVERDSPYAVSDGSRAIQDMMLVAWEEGIGSNWTGFGGLEGVRELLGLPEQYDILAVVPFGYPAQAVGRGRKERKPFDEVISAERYGQPFSWTVARGRAQTVWGFTDTCSGA
jgi:nitroreductase